MSNTRKAIGTPDHELKAKWEKADDQLTILVGAAAADLLHNPPHRVALGLAQLLTQRYPADIITAYAAMAITRLGMAQQQRLTPDPENGGG